MVRASLIFFVVIYITTSEFNKNGSLSLITITVFLGFGIKARLNLKIEPRDRTSTGVN